MKAGAPAVTVAAATLVLALAAPAAAQPPAPPGPRPGEVETAPIRCWWKTDTTHVRIGERFTVTLTCGVIETSSLKVAASTSALDPGGVQLTPFEVVSGTRRDDIVAPPWRYFQYDYRVRLMTEGFFGKDVTIPGLSVTYNIQASAAGGQGRDQTYVLPPLDVRVASLVPADASDIRDAATQGFEAIEARRFRATSYTVGGAILLGFAAVVVLLAAARAAGRVKARRPKAAAAVPVTAALGAAVRTLGEVKAEAARAGRWSPVLARRALAALRVSAAAAMRRPVVQEPARRDGSIREGQLAARAGLLRRNPVLISASTTASAVARALGSEAVPARSRASLESLRTALELFSAASYGRSEELNGTALDIALSDAAHAVRQLRMRSFWPSGAPATFGSSAAPMRPSMSEEG